MSLEELVIEAKAKSQEFSNKYNFWIETKRKAPDLEWLMRQLEEVLGRSYVKAKAEEEVKKITKQKDDLVQ